MARYFKEVQITRSFSQRLKMWKRNVLTIVVHPSYWINFKYLECALKFPDKITYDLVPGTEEDSNYMEVLLPFSEPIKFKGTGE
jgi:hypothetical protein